MGAQFELFFSGAACQRDQLRKYHYQAITVQGKQFILSTTYGYNAYNDSHCFLVL